MLSLSLDWSMSKSNAAFPTRETGKQFRRRKNIWENNKACLEPSSCVSGEGYYSANCTEEYIIKSSRGDEASTKAKSLTFLRNFKPSPSTQIKQNVVRVPVIYLSGRPSFEESLEPRGKLTEAARLRSHS